jgi:hypothetical protein
MAEINRDELMYLHCRFCTERHLRSKLEVGITKDGRTLYVGCLSCRRAVGTFTLMNQIAVPTCELCARGETHSHT